MSTFFLCYLLIFVVVIPQRVVLADPTFTLLSPPSLLPTDPPSYGPVEDFSPSYHPGSRMFSSLSILPFDRTKILLFGGYGRDLSGVDTLGDFWVFDTAIHQWSFFHGDQTHDKDIGHHALCGTDRKCRNPGRPGGMEGAVAVWDSGDFFLYGGLGYGAPKRGRITRTGLWVNDYNGDKTFQLVCPYPAVVFKCGKRFVKIAPGSRDDRLFPFEWPLGSVAIDIDSWPPARAHFTGLILPTSGLFFIFGGFHQSHECFNDAWEFTFGSNWQLVHPGTGVADLFPCNREVINAAVGVFDPLNLPGPRSQQFNWVVTEGSDDYVYIYGGFDNCIEAHWGDLWKYQASTKQFAILSDWGDYQFSGVYESGRSQYGPDDVPGSRSAGISFVLNDEADHPFLAIFGGLGMMENGPGFLNDFWIFDTATRQWASQSPDALRLVNDFGDAPTVLSSRYGMASIQTSTLYTDYLANVVLSYGGHSYKDFKMEILPELYRINFTLSCAGIRSWKPGVCQGRGYCSQPDICTCPIEYEGSDCEVLKRTCDSVRYDELLVCSGQGNCTEEDVCVCLEVSGFGYWCEETIESAYVPEGTSHSDSKSEKAEFVVVLWEVPFGMIGFQLGWERYVISCDVVVENLELIGEEPLCEWQAQSLASQLYQRVDRLNITLGGNHEVVPDSLIVLIPQAPSANSSLRRTVPIQWGKAGKEVVIEKGAESMVPVFVGLGVGLTLLLLCVLLIVAVTGYSTFVGIRTLRKTRQLKHLELIALEREVHVGTIEQLDLDESLFTVEYDDLSVEKVISSASATSTVYRCQYHDQNVCFKCFKTQMFTSQDHLDDFEGEVTMLKSLDHPYILSFIGCVLSPPHIGIISEFCANGDLRSYIQGGTSGIHRRLDVGLKIKILAEIASAMAYLGNRNIVHRDLKMTDDLHPKLIDFGLSRVVEGASSFYLTKQVGTCQYMAPEVILSSKYGPKCDVFSYGIVMFEVLFEDFEPYGGTTEFNVELRVALNEDFRPDYASKELSQLPCLGWYFRLMKRCWNAKPGKRPEFEQISEILASRRASVESRFLAELRLVGDEEALRTLREEESDSEPEAEVAVNPLGEEADEGDASSEELDLEALGDL